jgi:hypothetical protein
MVEHLVDQRQLAILDRRLFRTRAEEAVFEILDTDFEQPLVSHQRPHESNGSLKCRRGWIGDSRYAQS